MHVASFRWRPGLCAIVLTVCSYIIFEEGAAGAAKIINRSSRQNTSAGENKDSNRHGRALFFGDCPNSV